MTDTTGYDEKRLGFEQWLRRHGNTNFEDRAILFWFWLAELKAPKGGDSE